MSAFIPQYEPSVTQADINAVVRQMRTGWIGSSKTTEEFEELLAKKVGCKFAIATTSGTAALFIAIKSLELKKGSKVLFPAYTFLAGANAAKLLGQSVKLVDVKASTLSIDPAKIKAGKDVGCIIFVNHNGYSGKDLKKIKNLCKKKGVPLIEDSSQALGIAGAGVTGDFSILSFSVPKIVTTGQGGALLTNDPKLAAKARQLRDHGDNWRKDRIHRHLGINLKFNDILAALGCAQLNRLSKLLQQRKTLFNYYRKHLTLVDFGYESTWMVLYWSKKANEIIEALSKKGIQAVQYYRPVHHNPIYAGKERFPVAERIYKNLVYLPSSLTLSKSKIDKICSIVREVERPKRR